MWFPSISRVKVALLGISVIEITYERMMPFCPSGIGGSHVRIKRVEERVSPDTLRGGSLGTGGE